MAVVLVVDDEYGITNLLEDVLSDEGHRVLTATNGQQALERAREERPDAVLTDFMMPVMDGAALIEALTNDPKLQDIPVAVMSSVPEATVRERCPTFAVYVSKPFKIYGVIDIVAELLAQKSS
jgi:CheY-like chemotaxis protein